MCDQNHLEQQIEKLHERLLIMEQEWLQWKQNFPLSSNDASSSQQAEQPCTYQTMLDEEQN